MPVSVTFGSVGDIISVCIIIKDLVKALDDSRGSSAEYQEVIRELSALDRVLLEVELLWTTCERTNELNAIRDTAHRNAAQCRQSIEAFLKKIKKYGPSLRDGGSGSFIRDATMKVRWQVAHADELTKFRAEINAHCSAINMLLLTASVKIHKISDQRLHARLNLSEESTESSSQEQRLLLKDANDKLDENNKQIRAGNAITLKLSEALSLDWVRQLGNELKTFMRKIFVVNRATYKAVMDIQTCLPSHLERTLYQEPFILEDAIGRIAPVHMQFINSWEAFDSVLELRFRNMQGYKMVKKKEYVIQESATRREIGRSCPWEASFLPGQRVVMSMLFNDSTSSTSSCPRCRLFSNEPQDSDVQWLADPMSCFGTADESDSAGCGMWYRRVTEYNDVDPTPPSSQMPIRNPREEVVVFGQCSFKKVVFGPELPEHISASKKRKREDVQNDDITLFKRVRVLSKKTRVKRIKQISGPFTGLAAARNGFTKNFNGATSGSIISKRALTIYHQASETPSERKHLGQSMAASTHSMLMNAMTVPRTDHAANDDDSDDDLDDSDGGETDSAVDLFEIFQGDDGPETSSRTVQDTSINHSESDIAGLRRSDSIEEPRSRTQSLSTTSKHASWNSEDGWPCDVLHQVQRLFEPGVNVVDPWGNAVGNGNEVVTGALFLRGADVDNDDVAGWTGLLSAVEKGETDLTATIYSHMDYHSMTVYGNTAMPTAPAEGHISMVQMLLDHRAGLSTDASTGHTKLQLAIENEHVTVVRLLLECGPDGAIKCVKQAVVLPNTRKTSLVLLDQLLLQRGPGVEVKDKFRRTPLILYDEQTTSSLPLNPVMTFKFGD